ncbi:unnamed protein product [Clonostachys rhizophaga]|uniref:Uncharacterized protein n=1 Tax=Clonostachys rhizophaga TaxID=160324 RepID=A0A9N9YNM7_9HYPO|nr:unnamed protein product [Clonostachys rhizophaga]
MGNMQSVLSTFVALFAGRSVTLHVDVSRRGVKIGQVQSTALSEDKTQVGQCIGILRYLVCTGADMEKINRTSPSQIVGILHNKGDHWKCLRGARLKNNILELYLNSDDDEDTARQHGHEIAECFAFSSTCRLLAPEYLLEVLGMKPKDAPSLKDLPGQFTLENHKVAKDAFIKNGRVIIGFTSPEVACQLQRIAAKRDARFNVENVLNHTRPQTAEL